MEYVTDGDLGNGQPGSRRWHLIVLHQLETDEEIISYMKDALEHDIAKEGDVRSLAVEYVNGNCK